MTPTASSITMVRLAAGAAAFAVLMAAAPPAQAAVRAVTLAEALAIADAHNLTLVAARRQLDVAQEGIRQAKAANFPTLSANAGANNAGSATSTGNSGLTLAYNVDTSGARGMRIQVSEQQNQLARLEVDLTAMAVRYAVVGAYYDLQTAVEQERIAALTLKNAQTSLQDAHVMRRAGEGTLFDVQRAEVQLALAQQAQADAEAAHVNGRRALARTLGLDATNEIDAKDPVAPVGAWTGDLDANVARALARRPDLAKNKILLEMAKLQGRLALLAYRPETQLVATGNYFGAYGGPVGLPSGPGVTLAANAQWLLIDGGAARAAERQAIAGAAAAQAQLDDTVLQIRLEIQQARASLAAAQRNIKSTERGRMMATSGLDAARKRFKGGVGTQTDVLLAQADVSSAEANRVKAIIGFNRAHAALERAVDAAGVSRLDIKP